MNFPIFETFSVSLKQDQLQALIIKAVEESQPDFSVKSVKFHIINSYPGDFRENGREAYVQSVDLELVRKPKRVDNSADMAARGY